MLTVNVNIVENIKHWLGGSKYPTFNQIEEFSEKTYIPR